MKKKTTLITGGAGFIGSYLCELLLGEGFRVICMDNLITGSLSNVAHISRHPRFLFVKHDVSKFIKLKHKIFCVLHFASPASPVDYLKYPIQTLKVGSLGTHNALGVAKANRARFLLASTSEVYGDPLIHPQPETYWGNVNPVGPRGVYDEAKRFAEAIAMAYHNVHKVDVKIVRIFNTYGPRMRVHDGRAIPNFISQAMNNKPITIYGKGQQTRSFCYVTDLVRGLYRLMNSGLNEPVNIGNPNEMTIKRLAQEIIRLTGSRSRLVYEVLPQDDPKTRQPDISKAKRFLKWRPKIELDEGLSHTIAYFRKKGRSVE